MVLRKLNDTKYEHDTVGQNRHSHFMKWTCQKLSWF